MSVLADLDRRLQELHLHTAETPMFNPVFQLGLELSRQLESGDMSLDQVEAMVAELECESLRARAAWYALAVQGDPGHLSAFRRLCDADRGHALRTILRTVEAIDL